MGDWRICSQRWVVTMSLTDRLIAVTVFEIRRILIGWRMPVCLLVALLLFIASIGTAMSEDDPRRFLYPLISSVVLLISLYSVVSFADNVSDEFEKGTGLVVLTLPISRYTLFAGKFIAAYIPGTVLTSVYYMASAIACIICCGEVPSTLWTSLLLALLYLFAALGICSLVSCLSPGSNVSFVVCLLLLVVALFYFLNVSFDTEPWYVLGYESRIVSNHVLGVQTVFDSTMSTTDYQPLLSTATIMMSVYGVVTTAVAAVLFRYRQI